MIRYLIKNNLKLMFRSPANLFLYILCPLVILSVLSNAFSALMESYQKQGPFQVGYRITEKSFFSAGMETFKAAAKETDVTFEEYADGDPETLMESLDLKGFVEFGDDSYVVWTREDAKVEGMTLEYLLNAYVEEADRVKLQIVSAMAMGQEGMPGEMTEVRKAGESGLDGEVALTGESRLDGEVALAVERPKFMPAIDSTDYYGIVEIVYFGWCALICAAGILGNEKKYGIRKKYQVAGMSQLQVYLGRLLPMFVMVAVCEFIAALISQTLLEVHWGEHLVQSAAVMLFMVLAASAFELMIYALTDSMVLSVIISFAVVWTWGFFGGTFETYMFSSLPATLKAISPIYHGNRALTELSCMGHSDYVWRSLLISGGMTVVCSGLALVFGAARKRG